MSRTVAEAAVAWPPPPNAGAEEWQLRLATMQWRAGAPEAAVPLGAPVLFRHAKAGELAERFNEYLLVSQGKIVSRAKTYRGLGLSFF